MDLASQERTLQIPLVGQLVQQGQLVQRVQQGQLVQEVQLDQQVRLDQQEIQGQQILVDLQEEAQMLPLAGNRVRHQLQEVSEKMTA